MPVQAVGGEAAAAAAVDGPELYLGFHQFGEHLDALPLAQDLRNRLNNYQTFAEA